MTSLMLLERRRDMFLRLRQTQTDPVMIEALTEGIDDLNAAMLVIAQTTVTIPLPDMPDYGGKLFQFLQDLNAARSLPPS